MKHPDPGSADFPRHRRDGISALRLDFRWHRQFKSLVGAEIRAVGLADAVKYQTEIVHRRAAEGVLHVSLQVDQLAAASDPRPRLRIWAIA